MKQRELGRQGLKVSALGLGTMGMTMAYGPGGSDEDSIATIRHAYDLGITFFDTAELYGMGTGSNEILLGKAIAPFRDEVIVATKFGFDLTKPGFGANSRPENIRKVCDKSLVDLGTDVIDVLYQHRVDPGVPIEDVAGTVKDLITAGKVRYFGMSEAGPTTLRAAHTVQPVSVLQTEYSIFERAVEAEVLPACRALGIGFVPYSPLGRGFLTGDVKPASEYDASDMRRHDPRWQGDNYAANMRGLATLRDIATAKGVSVPQLALAWLLAQGDDIVPIPGTRSARRIAENARAAEVVLGPNEVAAVRAAFPNGAFGARYAQSFMPAWV
ncbi:MAG: aldo/keto reductase [Polyangiaceae bacterium]